MMPDFDKSKKFSVATVLTEDFDIFRRFLKSNSCSENAVDNDLGP